MLTGDFRRVAIASGDLVADLGCGAGRHSFELLRRGAATLSVDIDGTVLKDVAGMVAALRGEGDLEEGLLHSCVNASALSLPFADDALDGLIASEVLEHIPDDEGALREIARVVRPGGWVIVTVPRWWPERVCWALSDRYHSAAGGHVRIYRRGELASKLGQAQLRVRSRHHAHALHSPLWWLRCAFGVDREAGLPSLYHRFLVWDIENRPPALRWLESALNPLMGKSLVVYAERDHAAA